MKTVRVDFNMITDSGLVLADQEYASELKLWDRVEVIDFADTDLSFHGWVADIDDNDVATSR